jgi:Putative metal-binding motif/Right handed beta helix region
VHLSFSLLSLLPGCSTGWNDDNKDPGVVEAGTDTADADTDTDTDTDADTDADTDTDTADEIYVDRDGDGYEVGDDCDDDDATVHPGAEEICDGKDNDCDGAMPGETDHDGDGLLNCEDYCPVYALPGGAGDGRMEDPLGTIQEAIDLAATTACYEVRAFQGTYYENIDFGGQPVNVESVGGAITTIIDGGGLGSVVSFVTAETEDARIYDFTIRNGGGGSGAGINVNGASPTIERNIITDNRTDSTWLGGGIRSYNADPVIIDNEITFNDAGYGGPEDGCDGGGLNVRGGAPLIQGNFIGYNTAGDGGGMWLAYSDAWVANNWVVANEAYDEATESEPDKGGQGGGINVQIGGASGTVITNNVIADNIASIIGGGVVVYEASESYPNTVVAHNVIVYNVLTDTDRGAGLAQWSSTTPTVYHNVIFANDGVGAYAEEGIAAFTYNTIAANSVDFGGLLDDSGTGNLSVECSFTRATPDGDPENDDWTLSTSSACRNVGNPDSAYNDTDGSRADLGAYGGPSGAW